MWTAPQRGATGANPAARIPPWGTLSAIAALGVVACAVSAALCLANTAAASRAAIAGVAVVSIAAPIGVGLYAWAVDPPSRFARLLIASGFAWFAVTLAGSGISLLYSIGRVALWPYELLLAYVILSFPTGRLPGRAERRLIAAGGALIAVAYLPTALIVRDYPVPSLWAQCRARCPANAFMVTDHQSLVDAVVRPSRDLVAVALFGAIALLVGRRVRVASTAMRRTLTPVFAVAILRWCAYALCLVARAVAPGSLLWNASVWTALLAVPAMSGAFFAGLVRQRVFVARAFERTAEALRGDPSPAELQAVVADALGDPTLEIHFAHADDDGRLVDASGRPVTSPTPGSGRTALPVGDDGEALIVHDEALDDQPALVESVAASVASVLRRQRLTAALSASLLEAQRSRSRIASAADVERRRIEQDLHDGAQQHLVSLRVRLGLAGFQMERDPDSAAKVVENLGTEVQEIIDEIRSLARGIYPALLTDSGIAEALRPVARRSRVPTEITAIGLRRYAPEVESAVYFCCVEALQNVAKHADDASHVTIRCVDEGSLRFEVMDDGAGFARTGRPSGMGLTSMSDRLAAIGGEVVVCDAPGGGTCVRGFVPAAALAAPANAPASEAAG